MNANNDFDNALALAAWQQYLYRTPRWQQREELYHHPGLPPDFDALGVLAKAEALINTALYPGPSGGKAYDDRIDYHEYLNPYSATWRSFRNTYAYRKVKDKAGLVDRIATAVKATAAVMFRQDYEDWVNGVAPANLSERLAKRGSPKPYCGRYAGQLSLTIGTGFLVGENKLMTALHILAGHEQDVVYVFDFHTDVHGKDPIPSQVLAIAGKSMVYSAEHDVALVTLDVSDHQLSDRAYLRFPKRNANPSPNAPLYAVGYPQGLPVKLAMIGQVVGHRTASTFSTNLDTFHGNSGSPVLNLNTNLVEGMLVRGYPDLDYASGPCAKMKYYSYEDVVQGHAGEICSAAHAIKSLL